MQAQRKLVLILGAIILLGIISAQKIVGFYIDWLWFETYGFESVLFTVLGAQLIFGFSFGIVFFVELRDHLLEVAVVRASVCPV